MPCAIKRKQRDEKKIDYPENLLCEHSRLISRFDSDAINKYWNV